MKMRMCHSLIYMLQKTKYSPEETQDCDTTLPGKMTPSMLGDMAVQLKWAVQTKQRKRQFSVDYTENWRHIRSSTNMSSYANADKIPVFVFCKQVDAILPLAEGNVM